MKIYTTATAAEHLGISTQRVRQLIDTGQLPATKTGRDWIISASDLLAYEPKPAGRPPKKRRQH